VLLAASQSTDDIVVSDAAVNVPIAVADVGEELRENVNGIVPIVPLLCAPLESIIVSMLPGSAMLQGFRAIARRHWSNVGPVHVFVVNI
jgi:division protein CdvB (Snf7/Vps24/ESCRT-III family)